MDQVKKTRKNVPAKKDITEKKGADPYSEKEMVHYLLSTVREVIEVSRTPVEVLDKTGKPTGAMEYQAATVLKACELMAKLMGSIRESDGKGVSVQIVSYRDVSDAEDGSSCAGA